MKNIFSFIFAIFLLVSCQTSYEPANNNLPYGTWIYSRSSDSLLIYYSAPKFEKDKPGFAIKMDNIFIERTSGWCATPPLSYYNIEGKWELFSQNTIKINSLSWINDNYTRLMEIVSLNNNELKVIFHLQQNQCITHNNVD